ERLHGVALAITLEHERPGLVVPLDGVEVEELRELSFRVVREAHLLVGQRLRRDGQPPDAARSSATCSLTPASSSSMTCASGTMLSTPWPRRTTSINMSSVRTSTELVPSSTRLAVAQSSPRSSRR